MIELLPVAIGLGLAVSLIFSEVFGVAPGGMVVPGYMALSLTQPVDIALTVLAGFITFAFVRLLSPIVILYGRRRTALMILTGYLVGIGLRSLFAGTEGAFGEVYQVIGFIIPGLIAIWLDRQGVVETIATLMTVSVIVRLVLVLTVGSELLAIS